MNNNDQIPGAEVPEAEVINETTTVERRADTPPPVKRESVTPEQAKVDAVAELTMTAYAKASELVLTPDEQLALQKDFPDEAFRPGAAGKENLLYIEHAFLRGRLNEVLGLGQWSIIPRKRWAEDFILPATRDRAETPASRVYVEAMLVIRGCFVAEAIGDMVYYKNNQSQNYGDAVEGAKTAALRRCTKELGIGLQAWKKDWCEGWWQRNRGGRPAQNAPGRSGGSQSPPPARPAAPAQQSAPRPAARTADVVPPTDATEEQKTRFITSLSNIRTDALRFFVSKGHLTDLQQLEALPLKHVPATKKQYDDVMAQIEAFSTQPGPGATELWRAYPMPWGKNKDTPLGQLEKNYLYGLVMNYEVEREYNGAPKKDETIAKDEEFRRMLDDAGRHYDWIKEKQ
jgi:hypothetical protein